MEIDKDKLESAVLGEESIFNREDFVYNRWKNKEVEVRRKITRLVDMIRDEDEKVKAVNITDAGDIDGATSAALFRRKFSSIDQIELDREHPIESIENTDYKNNVLIFPVSHRDNYPDVLRVLDMVLNVLESEEQFDIPVYVTDNGVNEDEYEEFKKQYSREPPIYVRDHHELINDIENIPDGYAHDTDLCASQLVLRNDFPEARADMHAFVESVVSTRDLWKKDNPFFDNYGIFSSIHFHIGFSAFEKLIAAGVFDVLNTEIHTEVTNRMEARQQKIQYAIENNTRFETETTTDGEEITLATTFGDVYTSEIGRQLYEDHGADIVAIAKPSGDLSLRSKEEYPICNTIAREYDGGGHDNAAGGRNPSPDNISLSGQAKVLHKAVLQEVSNVDLKKERERA